MSSAEKKIIGRKKEQQILRKLFDSKTAEFLAIYGRRRVGKTYLIRRFFEKKPCVFFQVTGIKDGLLKEQLFEFTRTLEKTFYHPGTLLKEPKSWLQALDLLTQAINQYHKNKKIILFFDEAPWLATHRSRFLQAIDYYWNTQWEDKAAIKLIICGSAASWIIDNIISAKGGLHNRITKKIRLEPFVLNEVKAFLNYRGIKLINQQILSLYMVMGGVPYYLEHIEKGLSAIENIDHLCFSKNSLLVEEFDNLYASLFDHSTIHQELIRLIATKRNGIQRTQLLDQAALPSGGRVNQRLIELEEAGFIETFIPHGHKKRGKIYRLIDEYTLFYLTWIEPIVDSIRHRSRPPGYWQAKAQSATWKSWSGYAFESVCYKHIPAICTALNINPGSEIGSWRYVPQTNETAEGAQIDLLFDRSDNAITLCEIKHTNKPFAINKQYAKNLQNKIHVYKQQTRTNKQLLIAMITANGLKKTLYSEELIAGVVTLTDLFKQTHPD